MKIIVCGACGWLGYEMELNTVHKNSSNETINAIIKRNDLTCKCCPKCQATELFQKNPIIAPFSGIQGSWPQDIHASNTITTGIPAAVVANDAEDVSISHRPKDIIAPDMPEEDVEISLEDHSEDEETSRSEDVELTVDIVQQVLEEASGHGIQTEIIAKDLADGANVETKKVIAKVANVPVDSLTDSPKPTKKKKSKVRPDPKPVPKWECDVCSVEFESPTKSSRCKKCIDEYMQKMVG